MAQHFDSNALTSSVQVHDSKTQRFSKVIALRINHALCQQVLAAGDAPLAYQWWLGSTPVAGATAPILAVAGARRALHQGMYTVQASC